MSVSSIRIYVNMALEYIDSPYRVDDVEPNLQQAEQRLANIDPADAAPLYQQIAEIRARLENIVKPADARQVKAAEGKLRQARDYIDTNHGNLRQGDKDFVEQLFDGAVQYLDQITDAAKADRLKAPVLAEIDRIRVKYGTKFVTPPPPPKPATPPPPSQNFSEAKRAVFWANDYFTSPGRFDQVEPQLVKAEELLRGDRSTEAAELLAEIAALREKMADMVSPAEEALVRSIERDVRSIRDYMNQQREFLDRGDNKQELDRRLQKILDGDVTRIRHPRKADQLKAPIVAEISRLREKLGLVATSAPAAAPGYSSPSTTYPAPSTGYSQPPPASSQRQATAPAVLSQDDQDRLNRAKRTIFQARNNIESWRFEGVENLFYDATSVLAPVSGAPKDDIVAEIDQLRRDMETMQLAEDTRIITSELDRQLRDIENDMETPGSERLKYDIQSFKDRFAREDARKTLTPELRREYETRFANIMAIGEANMKAELLSRARPALQRLQERLATNPFTGLDQYAANRVDGEVRSMRWAVEREINHLPENDPDRQQLFAELENADAKLAGHSNEWGKGEVHEAYRRQWQAIRDTLEGWESESSSFLRPNAQPLEDPDMPKTRLAIHRITYFLHEDTYVQQTRDENPGDTVIKSIDGEAADMLEAAGAKMASAFRQIVDSAEKLQTPIEDQYLRGKAGNLLVMAEGSLKGTRFLEPVLTAVRNLDDRWKAEVEAVRQARENLCAKLTREGVDKWPSIVATIPHIVSSFDPSSARPGDAVHLRDVYNRSGWDFGGQEYGFSMRYNGVPLGGVYEDYIVKAMEYAVYHQKLRIDDHEAWDLVGVVLGPGSIRERTNTRIRRNGVEEEIEEWLPISCLRVKVIALRAGPVAVGPRG